MSLPRETIEQLLSGYMDEALSEEERGQLEELLRTDEDVAAELKELRSLRSSLQFISRADSTIRLDSGFADRVLDAAVQRARAEGLREDHPVVLLAEQPSTNSRPKTSAWTRTLRVAGTVAALAASIAIAFAVWKPSDSGDTDFESVAIADLDPVTANPETLALETMDPESPEPESMLAVSELPSVESPSVNLPSVDPEANSLADASAQPGNANRSDADEAMIRDNNLLADNNDSPRAMDTAERSVASAARATSEPFTPRIIREPQRSVGAVMVLEIAQTESGRMSRAVRSAMRSAEIKIQNEKLVAEDIVGVLGSGNRNDDSLSSASVLYLQGTAKQLDRFILSLCSDEQGIDSIRFGLASELPILNLLQQLKKPIDPTTVRHSASWSVQGDSPQALRSLTGALVDRTMAPLDSNSAALASVAVANEDGPDVMSQLFVVIR